MRRAHLLSLCASLILLGLLVQACGGSDDTTSTESSAVTGPMWSGKAPNTEPMAGSDSAEIDALAERILKESKGQVPGIWLSVSDPEKGSYEAAYGEAETPDTEAEVADHGRIGSISKTFTAIAVLKLVDSGQISLDDTISDLLPDLADQHPEIADVTLEQLLAMKSGIPDYGNSKQFLTKLLDDPQKAWEPNELIDEGLATAKVADPGTPYYSSTNFVILGEILAAETGQSTEDAVNEVVDDAGLDQTALLAPDQTAMPDPSSHGYMNEPGVESLKESGITVEPGVDVTDYSPSWGGAAGGMYSTVGDLESWAASGFGNSQLSKGLGEKRLGKGLAYGLGVERYGDWIGHTGQILGWESIALYNPKTGATAAAIVNETASLQGIELLLGQLFPDLQKQLLTG